MVVDRTVGFSFLALAVASAPAMAAGQEPVATPPLQPGDTWVLDHTTERGPTGFSDQRIDLTVEQIRPDGIVIGAKVDGAPVNYQDHIVGLDWSQRLLVNGQQTTSTRPFNFPMKVGDSWVADWFDPRHKGRQTSAHFHMTYKVVGWTDVVVPAGAFHALNIEANGTGEAEFAPMAAATSGVVGTNTDGTTITHTERAPAETIHVTIHTEIYYVPEIKYYVKYVQEQYNSGYVRTLRQTETLVSFKLSPR